MDSLITYLLSFFPDKKDKRFFFISGFILVILFLFNEWLDYKQQQSLLKYQLEQTQHIESLTQKEINQVLFYVYYLDEHIQGESQIKIKFDDDLQKTDPQFID